MEINQFLQNVDLADVLEKLNIKINLEPKEVEKSINKK